MTDSSNLQLPRLQPVYAKDWWDTHTDIVDPPAEAGSMFAQREAKHTNPEHGAQHRLSFSLRQHFHSLLPGSDLRDMKLHKTSLTSGEILTSFCCVDLSPLSQCQVWSGPAGQRSPGHRRASRLDSGKGEDDKEC